MNYFSNNRQVPVTLDSEQAASLIIERAGQLVNRLVENRGHDKPPFLPEEFIRFQGIERIEKADLGNTSAVLLRFQDGYVIKVNQKHSLARQNFSCAHEIGHLLFSELKLERYIQGIEYRTSNPQGQMITRAEDREHLCDVAAAELLMPESVFRKYLSGFGVSINSIERLANIFRASRPSVAIRIAEVSVEPCLALLWQPRPKNRPKGFRLTWCLGPGRNSRGKDYYMPQHTYVRPPSTLHKAYQYDSTVKSSRQFKRNNVVKRLSMESKGFGRGETRYVISLAFPDR